MTYTQIQELLVFDTTLIKTSDRKGKGYISNYAQHPHGLADNISHMCVKIHFRIN